MTRTEARVAFHNGEAVVFNGIEYSCISAIIYRYRRYYRPKDKPTEPDLYCELLDRNANSIVTVPAEKVHRKGERNEI